MTRIAYGRGVSLGISVALAGGGVPPLPFASPPEDWRMPATVALSSGDATALNAAQATAASKSRPSIVVAAGQTNTVTYTFAASATPVILSWTGQDSGTMQVTGGSYTPTFPTGSSVSGSGSGRRQFALVASGGTSVALQMTAGGSALTIKPQLHQIPATGTWDAHVAFGASREDQGMGSPDMESAIIAAFPTRDPIVFNYAKSGAQVGDLAALAPDLAAAYGDVACYVTLGSIIGNNVSGGRPYDASQKAALDASIATLVAALSGFVIGFGNTSYRAYSSVSPSNQTPGALPYNDNVIHPAILLHAPDCYDASLSRSRIDEYPLTLFYRAALADEVHGGPTQYGLIRAFLADQWYRFLYTGSWGASYIEQRVAAVEATPTLSLYDEAGYVVAALVASSAKTGFEARLSTVNVEVRYQLALSAVVAFENSETQDDKNLANAAVSVVRALEGNTSRVVALQVRIDAISVSTVLWTAYIRHGSTVAPTGWNATNGEASTGVKIADLLDDQGDTTGVSYEVIAAASGNSGNTAKASGVSWVPDSVMTSAVNRNGTSWTVRLNGCDPAYVFDIDLFPTRDGSSTRKTSYRVNGTTIGEAESTNNTTEHIVASNIAPVSQAINIELRRGTGNGSFVYHTATKIVCKLA